jgi:single-strand DNA-binding protein
MNTLRNQVMLLGRLGQDPELRNLEKGNRVASFSLATNDPYTDKEGNKKEQTEWHNIVAWGNQADRCEKYLKKGKEVLIGGKLTYRNWEDKSGVKHTTAEVVVHDLIFLGTKPENKE